MAVHEKSFVQALCPFSLSVAIASCGLGWAYAQVRETAPLALGLGVVVAGLLLQAGVNFINDYAERPRVSQEELGQRSRVQARFGAGAIALASTIGIGFVL